MARSKKIIARAAFNIASIMVGLVLLPWLAFFLSNPIGMDDGYIHLIVFTLSVTSILVIIVFLLCSLVSVLGRLLGSAWCATICAALLLFVILVLVLTVMLILLYIGTDGLPLVTAAAVVYVWPVVVLGKRLFRIGKTRE